DSTDVGDTIAFGFDIEKSSEALWKGWPADNLAISYWKNAGLEALQTVLPPIVSPSVLLETNWIKSESGIAGLVLRKGWFQADNLSLKKYLSPFVFQKDQMQLTGQGHFKGVFDHSRMTVEYVGENVFLENKHLTMEVKHIDTLDDPEKHSKLYAAHYFDFEKGVHFGSIPLVNASYFDKSSGLLFTDINAYITFEGQKVHLSDVEAQCNGIYFSGAIDADFDFPGDGVYEVEIRSHKLVGKVSQVQHLLYHFNSDFFFLNIPLEGDVTYRQKGGYLHFSFLPEDFEVKADVSGMISKGIMTSENTDTVLKDVKMNFAYNHENNSLEFSDIQGTLQMEGAQRGEEYILAGDYIRFDDYKRNVAEFDVWLGDQTRDVMRLVGKTVPKKEREGSHLIDFQINTDLTHFGDVHPSTFRLVMKESLEIEAFQLGLNMRLNTVLHDLQRFSPLGSLFFSRSLARGISSIKNASGKLRIDLRRDKRSSKFVYRIKGDEVAINDYAFEKCRLKGSASGDRWLIDELQLDELLLSANIEQKKDKWNANDLSFCYGQSIHLELEKGGVEKENAFKAHVNHLEINLSELKEWTALEDFIKEYSPH
ncbi:MAG: hypothetical protein ACE5DO_13805, partial [Desulfobacterales bacterium]